MEIKPHVFITSPGVTVCSNCSVTKSEAEQTGQTHCVVLSWNEKVAATQAKWFEGFHIRQLIKAGL